MAYQEGVQLLEGEKDVLGAISRFRQALRDWPDNPEALNGLGAGLLLNKNYEEAVKALRRSTSLDKNNYKAHFNLARALEASGALREAENEYQETVRINPSFGRGYYHLGHIKLQLNDVQGAIGTFQTTISLDPDHFKALNDLGTALLNSGDLKGALAAYQKANDVASEDSDIQFNYGTALMKAGLLDQAMVKLERAIQLNPASADAHFNLGLIYLERNRPAQALVEFERCKTMGLNDSINDLAMGSAYAKQGNLPRAVISYREALEKDFSLFEAHFNLGIAYREQRRVSDSIREFQIARGLRPSDPYTANELGVLLLSTNDVSGAITEFEKAIQLKPDYAEAHTNLGNAYLNKEKVQTARQLLEEAVRLNPERPKAHYNFGRAKLKADDLTGAINSFQKAVGLKPDFQEAQKDLGIALLNDGLRTGKEYRINEGIQRLDRASAIRNDFGVEIVYWGNKVAQQGFITQGNILRTKGRVAMTTVGPQAETGDPITLAYTKATSIFETVNEGKAWKATATQIPLNGPPQNLPTHLPQSAYWNVWFQEDQDNDALRPLPHLHGGNVSSLILSLASLKFDDPGVIWLPGDPGIGKEIKGRDSATVHVRTVLGGRGLAFIDDDDGKLTELKLTHLKRLTEPIPDRVLNTKEQFGTFTKSIESGRFSLRLKSTKDGGCASVGLSIWNEKKEKALDHVVRHVWVEPEASGQEKDIKELEECAKRDITSTKMRSGLITLLTHIPTSPAAAALHAFKLSPSQTAIIYLESEHGKDFGWIVEDDLAYYLTQDKEFLNAVGKGRNGDYSAAGEHVAKELFGPPSVGGKPCVEQRCLARESLKNLTKAEKKPTLFARLVDQEGNNLFLPLGLMKLDDVYLGDKVNIVQPLIYETYTNKKLCIRPLDWVFAIPDNLAEMDSIRDEKIKQLYKDRLAKIDLLIQSKTLKSKVRNRARDWPALLCYLQGQPCLDKEVPNFKTEVAQTSHPEGFVLLTHHHNGNIWFLDSASHLRYTEIQHSFSAGSIAILAGCNMATLNQGSHRVAFLEALNYQKVDAAIMSPFDVNLDFGMLFSVYFAHTILSSYEDILTKKSDIYPTISALFSETVSTMQRELATLQNKPFFEFVFAGNEEITLCIE